MAVGVHRHLAIDGLDQETFAEIIKIVAVLRSHRPSGRPLAVWSKTSSGLFMAFYQYVFYAYCWMILFSVSVGRHYTFSGTAITWNTL